MVPDRRQLQNMTKKDRESFKEYAQYWRELVAQAEPPLAERDFVNIFMDTLQPHFFEKMIRRTLYGLSVLVTIGERIKQGMKNGKILDVTGASSGVRNFSGNFQKKKEGETNTVVCQPHPTPIFPSINIKKSATK